MNALEKKYREEVVPAMLKEFGYRNRMAVPKITKVVVNVGTGVRDPKIREAAEANLKRITGQKPVVTLAKKSISSFKVRKGMEVGLSVTLRKQRMYDFLFKLINVTFPRVRDFRGLERKGMDGHGNLNLGFKDHMVFPEIRTDEVELVHGLEMAVVTTATKDQEAMKLLELLGFPFKKEE
ncbi:MAG: 50S ribosomal protein L5 [Patescibacteria group bacterium]|jgi:large subunit ribosomal protein L5